MLGKPMLGGVKHGQRLFMPVSSLRKKNLDAPTKQFVQKCSRPKMAATKNLKTKVLAPGGDNVAYKGSCRTSRAQPDGWAAFAEVEQRAAALQVSELSPVQLFYESQDFFECLRLARTSDVREACMAGKLQVSPRNAFDTEQHAWLTDAGVMEDDL